MTIGTVRFYDSRNGYGYIAPDDGSRGIFIQTSTLGRAGIESVKEGQKLSFDVERDPNNGRVSASNLKAI